MDTHVQGLHLCQQVALCKKSETSQRGTYWFHSHSYTGCKGRLAGIRNAGMVWGIGHYGEEGGGGGGRGGANQVLPLDTRKTSRRGGGGGGQGGTRF